MEDRSFSWVDGEGLFLASTRARTNQVARPCGSRLGIALDGATAAEVGGVQASGKEGLVHTVR